MYRCVYQNRSWLDEFIYFIQSLIWNCLLGFFFFFSVCDFGFSSTMNLKWYFRVNISPKYRICLLCGWWGIYSNLQEHKNKFSLGKKKRICFCFLSLFLSLSDQVSFSVLKDLSPAISFSEVMFFHFLVEELSCVFLDCSLNSDL